jgi:hypothetical protein
VLRPPRRPKRPATSVLVVAEPGRFQVQPALQPQAGGLADGAVVVQPGEFGVLGGVQRASQVPVGQAARLRRLVAVDQGAGAPDPGLQAGPGPVDRVISGAVIVGEFIQPGQRRLGQAQPGDGLLMTHAVGPRDPGYADQGFQGEPLHDKRDHDHGGGEAITANATSFLLPTSNITSLLLLHRRPLPATAYLGDSWLPWLLVIAVTVGSLAIWTGRRAPDTTIANSTAGPSAGALTDLIPMAGIVAAIRALLGTGLVLHGSLAGQLAAGSALTAAADNLPAAAAILPASTPGLWAAILATAIGPNLLLTGSVATLISRRIARDAGARLGAWQFTATGLALVPAQLAAALGLHLTGRSGNGLWRSRSRAIRDRRGHLILARVRRRGSPR